MGASRGVPLAKEPKSPRLHPHRSTASGLGGLRYHRSCRAGGGGKEVIKEIIKEVPIEKETIKEVENRFVVTRAASTAVLATPTKQSALDCQVTGSATVNRRPSVEYLLGVDHTTGEITNMLAKEWEASDDHVRSK